MIAMIAMIALVEGVIGADREALSVRGSHPWTAMARCSARPMWLPRRVWFR